MDIRTAIDIVDAHCLEQPVSESIDTATGIRWKSRTEEGWKGAFKVGGVPFLIQFEPSESGDEDPGHWHVGFNVDPAWADRKNVGTTSGSTGLSGTSGIKVLATAFNAILTFLESVQPERLSFYAEFDEKDADRVKPKQEADITRKGQLYVKILTRLDPKLTALGYFFEHQAEGGDMNFDIWRSGEADTDTSDSTP